MPLGHAARTGTSMQRPRVWRVTIAPARLNSAQMWMQAQSYAHITTGGKISGHWATTSDNQPPCWGGRLPVNSVRPGAKITYRIQANINELKPCTLHAGEQGPCTQLARSAPRKGLVVRDLVGSHALRLCRGPLPVRPSPDVCTVKGSIVAASKGCSIGSPTYAQERALFPICDSLPKATAYTAGV